MVVRGETSAVGRLCQMVGEWLDQMTSKVPFKIQRHMATIITVENEGGLHQEEVIM